MCATAKFRCGIHWFRNARLSLWRNKGVNESALVLTVEGQNGNNDGLLTASEITDLNLVTKFVSLSACNTAIYQPDYFAEETQGLTNAFLLARPLSDVLKVAC